MMTPKNSEERIPYASVRRYEEGRFELISEDLQTALDMATQVLEWAKKIVQTQKESNA